MRSRAFKYILFTFGLIAASSFASEHGGGGEEGKAEAGAEGKAAPAKKEALEYSKKAARINTLKGKVEEAEKQFANLLHEKEETHDPQAKQHLAEEMAKVDKEKKTAAKELDELTQELKYRFPNEGKDIDRHYSHDRQKGAAEKGDEGGEKKSEFDEKLTRVTKGVEKKYAPLMPKPTAAEEADQAKAEEQRGEVKPAKETKKRLQLIK